MFEDRRGWREPASFLGGDSDSRCSFPPRVDCLPVPVLLIPRQTVWREAGRIRKAGRWSGARPTWSTNVARDLNNGFQQCHQPPRHLCHQSLHACPLVVSNKRGNVESESWKGRALSKAATWWLLRSTPPGLDLTNHATKCQNANSEKETGNCSTCKLLIKPRSHVVTNVA